MTEYKPISSRRSLPRPLTDIGERVLEAIREADTRGNVLSVRELRDACGVSSTSVVAYTLRRLAKDGMLKLGTRTARSYRLTPKGRGAPTPDELLLKRCLAWLEQECGAVGGELVEDLQRRLCG